MLERELGIGVSNYISSFCHSVFRIEPFESCPLSCLYCYGRWYWRGSAGVRAIAIRAFEKAAKLLAHVEAPLIPFRLATLSEPLALREGVRLTAKVLRIALRCRVPVILNTKTAAFCEPQVKDLVVKAGSSGLLLLQVSVPFLRRETAKVLEPLATDPESRLRAIERVSSDVPVAVRVQPLIPGVNDSLEELKELLDEVRSARAKHIIAESVRLTPLEARALEGALGVNLRFSQWERYSFTGGDVRRPPLSWRVKVMAGLRRLAARSGLTFGTCKEGLLFLHDSRDCCGFRYLEEAGYRLTLYELWVKGRFDPQVLGEACEEECELLCGERLVKYPRFYRRVLIKHERRLFKVVSNKDILSILIQNRAPH